MLELPHRCRIRCRLNARCSSAGGIRNAHESVGFCPLRHQTRMAYAGSRRQGRQGQSDPGGAGPPAARHRADPGLLATGTRPLGAHVRHVAEPPATGTAHTGVTTIEEANRFLKDIFLPAHNARFVREPEDAGSAFVNFAGNVRDILCVQEDHVVGAMTIRCATRAACCRLRQAVTATISSRPMSGSMSIPTQRSPYSMVPGASAGIRLAGKKSNRRQRPKELREPLRRRPNTAGQTCGRLRFPPV